jgi:hypothetical protein
VWLSGREVAEHVERPGFEVSSAFTHADWWNTAQGLGGELCSLEVMFSTNFPSPKPPLVSTVEKCNIFIEICSKIKYLAICDSNSRD